MRTAVDSSVILDVLVADPTHGDASEMALRRASSQGALIIGDCVVAEIVPAFPGGKRDVEDFLNDWNLEFHPGTLASSLLAGKMFRAYLARRKKNQAPRVVPDFLIGAHAATLADRLLARDRGYYRDYFASLVLVEP
jgi:predicted nucleic acid-binding protein